MKTAAILSLLAGSAAAFAPSPVNKASTSLSVSADLEGMVGVSVETGNQVVSCRTGIGIRSMFMHGTWSASKKYG